MGSGVGQRGSELLDRLERYLDAVPRSGARAEPFGSLTLFVRVGPGWPFYARPTLGADGPVSARDLAAVRARQRELHVPEAAEWVHDTTPSLRPIAEAAGLVVESLPLMVLGASREVPTPRGVGIRVVPPDDATLATVSAVAEVGFGSPGTSVGAAGVMERDVVAEAMRADGLDAARARMRRGLSVLVAAEDDADGPIGVGWHQPVGDVSEVVGVATLPSARHRGLAAAVTARLVADARERGVATIFLTAGSDDVARVYARVGFERVGTSCIAALPVGPAVR